MVGLKRRLFLALHKKLTLVEAKDSSPTQVDVNKPISVEPKFDPDFIPITKFTVNYEVVQEKSIPDQVEIHQLSTPSKIATPTPCIYIL